MLFKISKYFLFFFFISSLAMAGSNRAALELSARLTRLAQNELHVSDYPKAFFWLSMAHGLNPDDPIVSASLLSLPGAQKNLAQFYLEKGVKAYQVGEVSTAKQYWNLSRGFSGKGPSKEKEKMEEYLSVVERSP